MPQHDLDIANASGAAVRVDLNNALAALGSAMKGPNAPPAPLAGMIWVDDDTPSATVWTVKQYDGADWIDLGRLDIIANAYTPSEGVIAWADVASAATVDLGAQASRHLRITGTTTITSFGTAASGTRRELRFAAALTLTNSGGLILPGGANITTAAGDTAAAISLGSGNWVVAAFQPAVDVYTRKSYVDAVAADIRIQRGTEVAPTGVSLVDFTGIPAGVRRITIMFDNLSFVAENSLSIQLGNAGGIETTGYVGNRGIVAGVATGTIGSSSTSQFSCFFSGWLASEISFGIIEIFNVSGNKWIIKSRLSRSGTLQLHEAIGAKTLSDVLDRVRVKSDGSDFDAGAINIFWEI